MQSQTGVLIAVEASGLTDVQAVTLRSDDGNERRYVIGDEARQVGHPPSAGHLRAHMTNGDRLTIRHRGDGVAVEIIDSP